jgi:cytochrome c peroxidase
MRRPWLVRAAMLLGLLGGASGSGAQPDARPARPVALPAQPMALTAQAAAGRKLFFDDRLSNPPGTACASCHDPQQGWGGNNRSRSGVAAGSTPQALGGRNSPTIGYAAFTPAFHVVREKGKAKAVGGLFWDGRADTLESQAQGPLYAPLEMNVASESQFAQRLRAAPYAGELGAAFGLVEAADDGQWARAGYAALAAYERSPEVSPFSSKYDAVLRGQAKFSPAEARGRRWFLDPAKGNCAACHEVVVRSKDPVRHLFTDFTYDTLGLPRNAAVPANADPAFFDLGLCGPARVRPKALDASVCGAFKVPTLRNVAKRPFLFHNGSFTDLTEAVRFYVERDTRPEQWYPRGAGGRPLVFNDLPRAMARNVNRDEVPYDRRPGQRPRLNEREIADLVAFLKTLDDGFTP